MNNEQFLKEEFTTYLQKLTPTSHRKWGVLSPQGMIEHMSDAFRVAYGADKFELHTPVEFLEKSKAFAMSDKPFKPETKNPLLSATPPALRNTDIKTAIQELQNEIENFISFFKINPNAETLNPIFGYLNYTENLHLLHKHAIHHLTQFELL